MISNLNYRVKISWWAPIILRIIGRLPPFILTKSREDKLVVIIAKYGTTVEYL